MPAPVRVSPQLFSQPAGQLLASLELLVAHPDGGQGGMGRIEKRPPKLVFLGIEPLVVVLTGVLDGVVIGAIGLQDHPASPASPPGPSGGLGHQLKGPLGGAKVGEAQSGVAPQDAHQGHTGKVMPLGNHLRAQEYIGLTGSEAGQDDPMPAGLPDGVGVHAQDTQAGQQAGQLILHALRPRPHLLKRIFTADGTGGRHGLDLATVVAGQTPLPAVQRERDGALTTGDGVAAGAAEKKGCPSPPVQHEHGLFPVAAHLLQRLDQAAREESGAPHLAELLAQINDLKRRQVALPDPPG